MSDERGENTLGRFHWLTGEPALRVLPWDIDLTPDAPFATVPSRGSIVPGWLLVLPRHPAINISALVGQERAELLRQARSVAARVDVGVTLRTTFFEHGPTAPGTPVGCGVDHAHLHTVPLNFDLLEVLPDDMGWREVSDKDPWADLGSRDYLLAGNGEQWLACEPNVPRSQFFRRLIAEHVGEGKLWDHNVHLWEQNVRRTVAGFW